MFYPCSVSINKRNLLLISTVMLKIINDIAPTYVKQMFPIIKENRHKLPNRTNFTIQTVDSICNGQEG